MDYTKEFARVDRLISEKRYQDAVRVFAFVLENTLKQVYGQIRLQACTGEAKRLLDIEEKISRGEKIFNGFRCASWSIFFAKRTFRKCRNVI